MTNQELLSTVDEKINKIEKDNVKRDNELNERIDQIILENAKRFLVMELTKIQEGGYVPNMEEKRIIHETKKIYNDQGGDSYVDTMFDKCVQKNLL